MSTPSPLPTPTLRTRRLTLRAFAESGLEAVYAIHSDPRAMRDWNTAPWTDREQARAFLQTCQRMSETGSGARFVIETASDGAFIGWCATFGWNPINRSLGIGYGLTVPAWGHGYATEALRAVLQWAYATLDLNRVEAELDTRNAASARVLEKLGFQREGLRRENCVVAGEVSDSWIYGLLRRDWEAQGRGAAAGPQGGAMPPFGAAS